MDHDIDRRDFLKAAPPVAGLLTLGLRAPEQERQAPAPYPTIGAQPTSQSPIIPSTPRDSPKSRSRMTSGSRRSTSTPKSRFRSWRSVSPIRATA